MIKIWSMKKDQTTVKKKAKVSPAQIRLQKDVSELSLPHSMVIHYPDPKDQLHFNLYIQPEDGFYKNGTFKFSVAIPEDYPHTAPKVHCERTIYHPNIDLQGNVCLNILREDWKPVLNLTAVTSGMLFLFVEPNPDDPLNKEAANELRATRDTFARNVIATMSGRRHPSAAFASTEFFKVDRGSADEAELKGIREEQARQAAENKQREKERLKKEAEEKKQAAAEGVAGAGVGANGTSA